MRKKLIGIMSAAVIGLMFVGAPAIVASPSMSFEMVEKGDCDKCGKEECKGCEAKSESAEKGKSCAEKGEGKSCCSKGAKKGAKKEVKEEIKK